MNMLRFISLKEAWDVLRSVSAPSPRKKLIPVEHCAGRISAEDICSDIDVPGHDIAVFDGYAVLAEDVFSASPSNPILLRLTKSSSISPGEARAICVGDILPSGANAVVPKEFVKEHDSFIEVFRRVTPYAYVARRGEDIRRGGVLVKRGELIDPFRQALLMRGLIEEVAVYEKVNIGLIVIGDELTRDMNQVREGKVLDVTSSIVSSILEPYAHVKDYGIIPDDIKEIENVLSRSAEENDLVVTLGGTSMGPKDYTVRAVRSIGDVLFHGVSIMPGRPAAVGKVYGKLVFVFSGLPVAAYNELKLLLEPFLLRRVYGSSTRPIPIKARATTRIPSRPGVIETVRVRLMIGDSELLIVPLRSRGSGILSSLALADGVVVVPEELEGYEKGEVLNVFRIGDPWGVVYVQEDIS